MRGRKSGQITIFIIVAIILVAAVLLFFLIRREAGPGVPTGLEDPQQYIEDAAKDSAKNAIDIILPQGGYLEPKHYILYKDKKFAYLCYQKNFYLACINQEPLYIKHLEDEITTYITPKIDTAFYDLKQNYEKKGYDIEMASDMDVKTELGPGQVRIKIKRLFVMTKGDAVSRFDEFTSSLNSPIYNLAELTVEIVSQEAKYGYFEYLGYMLLHPQFEIDRTTISGSVNESRVYTIADRKTGQELNFAVRGVVIPPGF